MSTMHTPTTNPPLAHVRERYGTVAVTVHWVSAALVLVMLGTGFRAAAIADAAGKAAVLRVHVIAAVLVLLLTAFRIAWWWRFDDKPGPLSGTPVWQNRAARGVHALFYVVIVGMLASGIGLMLLSGAGPSLFGANVMPLPDFWQHPPRVPHGIGARLLVALLVVHIGAALYHQVVRRDRLLQRMWFRT